MHLISMRVDDKTKEQIEQFANVRGVSKSEMLRAIILSGIRHIDLEKDYLDKIYRTSVQNWVFTKHLLLEMVSKEKVAVAQKEAEVLLENNKLGM